MLITYDYNRHLTNFLSQHHQYESSIRQDIANRLTRLVAENSPK